MLVYTVTKIFGTDAVKTRVFRNKNSALNDINDTILLLVDDPDSVEKIEKENEEIYFIINRSDVPEDFIEIVLRRNELL